MKIFNKTIIRIKAAWSAVKSGQRAGNRRRLFKDPLFYFAVASIFLFWGICISCDSQASMGNLGDSRVAFFNAFFNKASASLVGDNLFSSKTNAIPLETPDLKIIQDNAIAGLSTPRVISGKVLGDVFGGTNQDKKEVVNYIVQPGDTLQSIAGSYKISVNTLLWANSLITSSIIKVGQSLAILPVDGVLHVVRSGDTISGIAQIYKAQSQNIVSYNNLASQDDIYVGDILIVPGGTMPKTAAPIINDNQVPLASNYFIFPTQGRITQGLHYYNAIDVANSCGAPVYAAASGKVQRAVYNNAWNAGMGNYVTILHPNGAVTYYGHLSSVFVKPGDSVTQSDRIGLIGNTGNVVGATGCHLHFQVVGAVNPLAKYPVGTKIHY